MATSCGPTGHFPETSVSGLKRWSLGWTLKARDGEPWPEITLPSRPTRVAVSVIPPSACATPGRLRTFGRSDSENEGGRLLLVLLFPNEFLPLMTASVLA